MPAYPPKRNLTFLYPIIVCMIAGLAFLYRQDIKDVIFRMEQGPIPAPVTHEQIVRNEQKNGSVEPKNEGDGSTIVTLPPSPTPEPEPVPTPAPPPSPTVDISSSYNLAVMFIPQAPFQVWDAEHEEACEEAAMSMIKAFYDGTTTMSREEMENRLMAIIDYERKTLGFFESTTAAQTTAVMRDFLGLSGAEAVAVDSIDDIKKEIAAGRPVMLPTSGKLLGNPNFKNGGPEYHMVVAKGYTATRIITNDPGTRKGADYTYTYDTLWKAMGNWAGDHTDTSQKVMIVVK